MSRTFPYRPVVPPPPPVSSIGLAMFELLCQRVNGRMAVYDSDREIYLDTTQLGWLTGVRDATQASEVQADANDLIEAIEKHRQIVITVEH